MDEQINIQIDESGNIPGDSSPICGVLPCAEALVPINPRHYPWYAIGTKAVGADNPIMEIINAPVDNVRRTVEFVGSAETQDERITRAAVATADTAVVNGLSEIFDIPGAIVGGAYAGVRSKQYDEVIAQDKASRSSVAESTSADSSDSSDNIPPGGGYTPKRPPARIPKHPPNKIGTAGTSTGNGSTGVKGSNFGRPVWTRKFFNRGGALCYNSNSTSAVMRYSNFVIVSFRHSHYARVMRNTQPYSYIIGFIDCYCLYRYLRYVCHIHIDLAFCLIFANPKISLYLEGVACDNKIIGYKMSTFM